jgi:hypothetical protein
MEAGIIATVLTAGLILMYRHFTLEAKEYKSLIKEKDAQIIELNNSIRDIVTVNTELNTRLLDTLIELKNIVR